MAPDETERHLPFIISSKAGKADPAARKFIRSHVMQGKNRKPGNTRQRVQPTGTRRQAGKTRAGLLDIKDIFDTYIPPTPLRMDSDALLMDLPIDPVTLLNVTRVSRVAVNFMFPLMVVIGWQPESENWLDLLRDDLAGLHITAFAMEELVSKIIRGQTQRSSVTAMQHLQKGLKILRERLLGDEPKVKISDSTLGVVLKLAGSAHFNGDHKSSKHHMDGLRIIVDLRGGLQAFGGTQLYQEMLRCDLAIALHCGSAPIFFRRSSEPVPDYPEALLRPSNEQMESDDIAELIRNMDDDLATAWRVLKRFCLFVNIGTQTQRFIRPETMRNTMAAITYRLLDSEFAAGSLNETVRYGILVFCFHVFLQCQNFKLPYTHFAEIYRARIMDFVPHDNSTSQLALWLLMIGAISIFHPGEDMWLSEQVHAHAKACGVKTWKDMHIVLRSFMWIELLDDRIGERITNLLLLGNDST